MPSAKTYLKSGDAIRLSVGEYSWLWDFEKGERVPIHRSSGLGGQLAKQLDQLEEKLALRLILGGLREGGKVFRLAAQDVVPVRKTRRDIPKSVGRTGIRYPGYLRRGIIYRTDPKRVAMRPIVRVGPRTTAFYGYFFETGRRRSPMPMRRFMSQAFQRAHFGAVEAVANKIAEGLFKARGKYT